MTYFVFRSLRAVFTILGVVTIVFFMVRWIPGDPVSAMLGDQASPEDRIAMRQALHLDLPWLNQYGAFIGDVFDGSLGHSFRAQEKQVSQLIGEVLEDTALLALGAILVAWSLGIPLGVFAALRSEGLADQALSTFALLGVAIPNIWLGPLLILLFGMHLHWLPLPGDDHESLRALVLPSFTIGTALMGILARQTRSAMRTALAEPFIRAVTAKGVARSTVIRRHALRNALLPIVTVGAAQLAALLSGTVITEKIFERPGLGALFLDAFFARDIPVIQGCVIVIAVCYVGVNWLLDISYAWIDPRVRVGGHVD